jgi:O-antigen/teichoic acid export membrane protein
MFLFVWLVQLSYNGSVTKIKNKNRKEGEDEIEKINYWTAFVVIIFITLVACVITSVLAPSVATGVVTGLITGGAYLEKEN